MFPKYAAPLAALLCVGFGLSASAAPVITKNDKTGDISIVDKATGERVVMTDKKLTYSGYGKHWKVSVTGHDSWFSEVILNNKAIYVSNYQYIKNRRDCLIIKYDFARKVMWRYSETDCDRIYLDKLWGESNLLEISTLTGDLNVSDIEVLNAKSGHLIPIEDKILSISNGILLLRNVYEPRFPSSDTIDEDSVMSVIKFAGYKTYDLRERKYMVDNFPTPPRFLCFRYTRGIKDIQYLGFQENELGLDGANFKPLAHYYNNQVRGDYIYAHRTDCFGKFTYRFHWTDPKNPGPVILQGWR